MSAIKNISLFVPHVFPNFDETYVADVFSQFGRVDHVDLVAKQDRNGKLFNSAYIHFESWNNKTESHMLQKHILDGKAESRVYHDGPWYWIVLENKGKKHVSGDRKPRIDLGEDNVIKVDYTTPQKPVLKRGEPIYPNAPEKRMSYADAVSAVGLTTEWPELQRKFMKDIDLQMEGIEVPVTIGPNDYAKSFIDSMEDDALYAEAEEMLEQMEEIEAELEAEDANLVSIDRRYVNEVEVENLWLRNEVTQLRAALLNMDYLYQAEAAKVRALNVQFVNVIPQNDNENA